MKISIVIPSGRRPEDLVGTVRSCFDQDLGTVELEILVVANPPDPSILELIARFSDDPAVEGVTCRLLSSETRGANRARNLGAAAATGDVVLFLDDDCVLPRRGYVRDLALAHAGRSEVDGLGGTYLDPEAAPGPCRFYNAMVALWLEANRLSNGDQLVLVGGCASYKRRVLDHPLRFDESLTYGGTETEFNHRIVSAGYRLALDHRLDVVHDFRGSWLSLLKRAWKQGRGKGLNRASRALRGRKVSAHRWRAVRRLGRLGPTRTVFFLTYSGLVQLGCLTARLSGRRAASPPAPPRRHDPSR